MINWETASSFATAAGTLVLAVATFSAVRSANRSARIAERSFRIGLRPILAASREGDVPQRVMFADRHWVTLEGSRAAVEVFDEVIYLAMLVRNVGNGMAMIEAWSPIPGQRLQADPWTEIDDFRTQSRALWIAPGDVAFWQGALRDPSAPLFSAVKAAVGQGVVTVELLYRDHEGAQRTISRFSLIHRGDGDGEEAGDAGWWSQLGQHRPLDDG